MSGYMPTGVVLIDFCVCARLMEIFVVDAAFSRYDRYFACAAGLGGGACRFRSASTAEDDGVFSVKLDARAAAQKPEPVKISIEAEKTTVIIGYRVHCADAHGRAV